MQNRTLIKRLGYVICLYLLTGLTLPACQKEHDYNPTWTRFKVLSEEFAKQFHQNWITSGTSMQLGDQFNRTHWAYTVMEVRDISLPEARILAAKMLRTILDAVLEDPLYINYYPQRHAEDPTHGDKIEPAGFGFRVTFWDQNMDRPKPSFIAQIQAADGWVTFHYADPITQALIQPPAETISYEDLLALLKDEPAL